MIRFLIWLLLGYIGFRIVKGILSRQDDRAAQPHGDTETRQDPVCGTYVAVDDAVVGRLNDERVYFCSRECLETYRDRLSKP